MNFDYKITPDEYAAGQVHYYRMRRGSQRRQGAVITILAGLFFIIVAWNHRPFDRAQFVLAIVAAFVIYSGIVSLLLPARAFRKWYPASELADATFHADVNQDGFEVATALQSWRVKWQGVGIKAEDDRIFVFYSQGTIFTFGKQYLTAEQQAELRRLSGMIATPASG